MTSAAGACPLYFGIGLPRTTRFALRGRYKGMVDTIVRLFRAYLSGVMTRVHAIWSAAFWYSWENPSRDARLPSKRSRMQWT
jgi:hypothetical protein